MPMFGIINADGSWMKRFSKKLNRFEIATFNTHDEAGAQAVVWNEFSYGNKPYKPQLITRKMCKALQKNTCAKYVEGAE